MRRFRKKTRFVVGLMLACLLSGCGQVREIVGKYESEPKETVKLTSESEYTYLSNEEEILEYLLVTMKDNKSACNFNVDAEELIDGDRWIAKLGGITNVSINYNKAQKGYNVYVTLEYWDNYPIVAAYEKSDTTGLTAKQVTLLNKYYEILGSCVKTGMTAYEKELAVHDYLVENVTYDTTRTAEDTHSAYGALVLGRAVCDGYAESFQTLMDMLGIECRFICGTGNREQHAWNMVLLDGAWYHVDVTFDDPVGSEGLVSHKYFNITDAEMNMDHMWEHSDYPMAVGNKYSYYLMGGITKVNGQDEFNNYIVQCLTNHMQQIEVVAYGNVDLETALKKAGISFSYSYDVINKGSFKVYELNIVY